MGKIGLTLVSLLGAAPCGYLGFLMVMTIKDRFEDLHSMLQIFTALTLGVCGLVAMLPVAVLVFYAGPATKPKKGETDEDSDDADGDFGDDEALDEGDALVEPVDEDDDEVEMGDDEFEEETLDGDDDFESDDEILDVGDDFEEWDDEEEEE